MPGQFDILVQAYWYFPKILHVKWVLSVVVGIKNTAALALEFPDCVIWAMYEYEERLTFISVFSHNSGTTNVTVPSMSVTWCTDAGHVCTRLSGGSLSWRSNGCLPTPPGGATVCVMLATLRHSWNWPESDNVSDKVNSAVNVDSKPRNNEFSDTLGP